MNDSILEDTFMALPRQAKIIIAIVGAIIAALLIFVIFFYGRAQQSPVTSAPQPLTSAQEMNILNAMTPTPVSDATLTKNEKTLNAIPNSSPASLSNQDKIGVILQMQIQAQ